MSNIRGAERTGVVPHYTWENTGSGGYHLNGAFPAASILKERVFPSLATLPSGSLVADFGCGKGRVEKQASAFGDRPYVFRGFELNSAAVEQFNAAFADTPDQAEVADLTRLDIGQNRFDAGLFWRVLHSIPSDIHQAVLAQVTSTLKKGASLHVAVLSERDWKKVDLERLGFYRSGEMNECYPVMEQALKPERISSWPLYFFREGELARLGEQAGLMVVYQEQVQELSGYEVLNRIRPPLSYDYVELRKP